MGHNHEHHIEYKEVNLAFKLGIGLNLLYVAFEAAYGILYNSTALLSDAGHNFSDIITLVIGAISVFLSSKKTGKRLSYGYRKITILSALFNSLLLIAAVGIIFFESIKKIINPQPLNTGVVFWVALLGIVINSLTAFLFLRWTERDINLKAVFWHMALDALVSLGVVLSAVLMQYLRWYWLDGLVGVIISIIIVFTTWDLLKESFLLAIDAVPKKFDIERVKQVILQVSPVKSVHHVHLWALSTTEPALTAHVVLDKNYTLEQIMEINKKIQEQLHDIGIEHTTLEFELEGKGCIDPEC